jgi:putative PIN family toxin of toxin-antitoxin system
MRVMLDSNIFFSFLWSPYNPNSTLVKIVEAALSQAYVLVIPAEVLEAMEETLQRKDYLRNRVTKDYLRDLVAALGGIATESPRQSEPWPEVVRDPKDDYLLAAAVHADVDVLVSGDRDLLVLAALLAKPRIMSPREFLELIDP